MTTPHAIDSFQYPIGKPDHHSPVDRTHSLAAIREFPRLIATAYAGLDGSQLDTPYRDGGWTLRQLAHHLADSHMNAFIRVKLALTEDWPTIRPYDEKRWAETAEVGGPVDAPLLLLNALHLRWAAMLEALTPEQWERGYLHPESGRTTLTQTAGLYSWHGRHHLAQVTGLRARMGWSLLR